MNDERQWVPAAGGTGATVVTGSQEIRDETARVAAAAGLELTMAASLNEAQLLHPAVLLVGSDNEERRPQIDCELILVGLPGEETLAWEAAARLHASRVAILPTAADWLAERFASLQSTGTKGHLLGVMGAAGGAGTTTLSCWLALAAARTGRSTLLVDGDCGGGGLDVALGSATQPGVRWADLSEVSGTLNPGQLAGALQTISGVGVLSMSGSPATEAHIIESTTAQSVLDAVRANYALTILDLPSGWPWGGPLLPFCDEVVLVVPARTRPIAAGRAVARTLQSLPTSVIARGPLPSGFDPHRVAELVGRPLRGYLPHLRRVPDAERQGRLLENGAHRWVRRLATDVLAAVPHQGGAT